MTAPTVVVRAWVGSLRRWLFDPVPVHSLVLCRIGLGAVLFLAYLSRWSLVDSMYGPDGFAGHFYFQRFPESGPVSWPFFQRLDYLQHVASGSAIWALYVALLASSLCFALGAWPWVTGTIALVLHSLFMGRNPGATWGWATMIKPFMIYTILASTGRHCSVLTWLQTRLGATISPAEWVRSAWPLRLVQVHLSCVFLALWARIDEGSWLSGQMLAATLMRRDWARFDIDWFPLLGVLEVFCWAALVLELGAAFVLWIKPVGRYWALALIGMFSTLVVTTSVGWWDVMMIVLLTAFLPEPWLRHVIGPRHEVDGSPGSGGGRLSSFGSSAAVRTPFAPLADSHPIGSGRAGPRVHCRAVGAPQP